MVTLLIVSSHNSYVLCSPKTSITFSSDNTYPHAQTHAHMQAFIELQKEGLIKNIGVSNFNEYQIGRLIKESTVVPCMNQIEVNPYLVNDAIIKYCQSNQVAITAYSPLGSPDRPW